MDNELKYKRNIGNGKLTYPIGTITADEIAMAGGVLGESNTSYYLRNEELTWSMSLATIDQNGFNNTTMENFKKFVYDGGTSKSKSPYYLGIAPDGKIQMVSSVDNKAHIRPVVSLKSDILFCGGNGSETAPYKVGNGSC